jgi:hypothetical protein
MHPEGSANAANSFGFETTDLESFTNHEHAARCKNRSANDLEYRRLSTCQGICITSLIMIVSLPVYTHQCVLLEGDFARSSAGPGTFPTLPTSPTRPQSPKVHATDN